MYVSPYENSLGLSTLAPLGEIADGGLSPLQTSMPSALEGDGISLSGAPWLNAMTENPAQTAAFGPLASLMQQLMQMLQSFMGSYGGYGSYGGGGSYGGYGSYGNCPPYGGCPQNGSEQFYGNANGASVGDPHLSFNGSHWNSMASQSDLLNSDSIPGGFQISTQVTAPNAQGITYNQCATVSLNNGQTTISMNNAGQPSIESFGQNVPIAMGQTVQLGNGTSVTCNQNGSLSVVAQNGYGGQITSTLTPQGQGVNVNVSAQNVDLGGALVNGNQTGTAPTPWQPIAGPVFGPVNGPVFGPTPDPFPISSPPVVPSPGQPIDGAPATVPHLPIVMHPD